MNSFAFTKKERLAIVKHAVQSLGGKIWVESAPGRGSRFYFTIQG